MHVPFKKVKWDNNNQFGIHRNKIGVPFPALILTITCGTKEISFRFFFRAFYQSCFRKKHH